MCWIASFFCLSQLLIFKTTQINKGGKMNRIILIIVVGIFFLPSFATTRVHGYTKKARHLCRLSQQD